MAASNDRFGSRVLLLRVKGKWFKQIASGQKKEEYRVVKNFWTNRLTIQNEGNTVYRQFDFVKFINGYSKESPWLVVECKGITRKEVQQVEFDGQGEVFAILLGRIVEWVGNMAPAE